SPLIVPRPSLRRPAQHLIARASAQKSCQQLTFCALAISTQLDGRRPPPSAQKSRLQPCSCALAKLSQPCERVVGMSKRDIEALVASRMAPNPCRGLVPLPLW